MDRPDSEHGSPLETFVRDYVETAGGAWDEVEPQVYDVILPTENQTNVLEDLTPEQLQDLNIHYVNTIEEALEISLPSSPKEEKQDAAEREERLSKVTV